MKRRNAVKGIILFSLGTGIIYSCTDKYKAIKDLGLKHFTPKNAELDLIEKLSLSILPLHTIPEFKGHTALPLMFTMLDDVYKMEDKVAFQQGYQNFDSIIESTEKKTFIKLNNQEQEGLLEKLNNREEGIDPTIQAFFDIVKKESLRYLKTSEFYQRKVNYYEMAPGRFKGNVLISDLKNANSL
jgi:hypothetical protein